MPSQPRQFAIISILLFFSVSGPVFGHAGHGDEFQSGETSAPVEEAIEVDADTAERLGIELTDVTAQPLMFGIKANGQLELLPHGRATVTSPGEGRLTQVLVTPGESVTAGEPIAVFSSPGLAELYVTTEERRVEAQTGVQVAQAELQLAQQNYAQQQQIAASLRSQAELDAATARTRYENDTLLLERGVIAQQVVAESEIQLAQAETALAGAITPQALLEAEADLGRAHAKLQEAELSLRLSGAFYESQLQQLGGTVTPEGLLTLVAPITGDIAEVAATPGQSLSDTGELLMTIASSDRLLATANVPEKDLPGIALDQSVRIEVASLSGQLFSGRVVSVGAVVDNDTRVVPVSAEIENLDGNLKAGMFAELEILTEETPDPVMVIPQSAVLDINDRTFVFVENGNVFEPVDVELGRTSGDWVEVNFGLFEGDRVVSQRTRQLYAQSLRGGGSSEEDGHGSDVAASGWAVPWWGAILAGGALAGVTFWAGTAWSTRRHHQSAIAAEAPPIPSVVSSTDLSQKL